MCILHSGHSGAHLRTESVMHFPQNRCWHPTTTREAWTGSRQIEHVKELRRSRSCRSVFSHGCKCSNSFSSLCMSDYHPRLGAHITKLAHFFHRIDWIDAYLSTSQWLFSTTRKNLHFYLKKTQKVKEQLRLPSERKEGNEHFESSRSIFLLVQTTRSCTVFTIIHLDSSIIFSGMSIAWIWEMRRVV